LIKKGDIVTLFEKYVEVYSTLSLEKIFTAKTILANNNIQYNDTSTNNHLRLSFNNFRGNNYFLSRDGAVKTIYSVSVKKKDVHKARLLLKNI